ncbi:MAG: lipopolysaccharide biosynthesis protein [Sandaracinaceae bacterium]
MTLPPHAPADENRSSLADRVLGGIAWSALGNVFQQVVAFGISVTLARLLSPREFGVLAMVTVLLGFGNLLAELGFTAALIQRKDLSPAHLDSAVWLTLESGSLLGIGFALAAPAVARFYSEPQLVAVTRVMAVNFVLVPTAAVQLALMQREMRFKKLAAIGVGKVVLAGAVGVTLAALDQGIWSLVAHSLCLSAFGTAGLWLFSSWRPRLRFSVSSARELWDYSGSLIGFGVANFWARNADNILVGRFIGATGLGIYSRAYSTMLLPLNQIAAVLTTVMFPALASIQDDRERLASVYLRAVGGVALVTTPVMLGVFVLAEDFVLAVFGSQWAGVVPVLQVLVLLGVMQSLASTVGWLYQALGHTRMMFRWGLFSSAVIVAAIGVGVWMGSPVSVAGAYAGASVLLTPLALLLPGRLVGLGVADFTRAIWGPLAAGVLMAVTIGALRRWSPLPAAPWPHLLILAPLGALIYWVAVSQIFRVESYVSLRTLLLQKLRGRAASTPNDS